MIKFSGKLSTKCTNYLLKANRVAGTKIGGITALIFSVIVIIIAITVDLLYLLFLPCLLLFVVLVGMPPSKENYNLIVPTTVFIEDEYVVSESEKFSITRKIEEVKEVVDYGEWYHLHFRLPYNINFICQKDLIVQGTIEEFEELFKDKIIRKY